MVWIAGADGFKSRWIVVLENTETGELRSRLCGRFAEAIALAEKPSVIAIDIPIGLPPVTPRGGRACERMARKVLGRKASSVFSAVGRLTLKAESRLGAHRFSVENGGVGVGAQAWGLATKLKEADEAMTVELQSQVYEVHPEVSFAQMNGGVPVFSNKKTVEGILDRSRLLTAQHIPIGQIQSVAACLKVPIDDLHDACAALWTARRILEKRARRYPETEDRDERGLDQAIWF